MKKSIFLFSLIVAISLNTLGQSHFAFVSYNCDSLIPKGLENSGAFWNSRTSKQLFRIMISCGKETKQHVNLTTEPKGSNAGAFAYVRYLQLFEEALIDSFEKPGNCASEARIMWATPYSKDFIWYISGKMKRKPSLVPLFYKHFLIDYAREDESQRDKIVQQLFSFLENGQISFYSVIWELREIFLLEEFTFEQKSKVVELYITNDIIGFFNMLAGMEEPLTPSKGLYAKAYEESLKRISKAILIPMIKAFPEEVREIVTTSQEKGILLEIEDKKALLNWNPQSTITSSLTVGYAIDLQISILNSLNQEGYLTIPFLQELIEGEVSSNIIKASKKLLITKLKEEADFDSFVSLIKSPSIEINFKKELVVALSEISFEDCQIKVLAEMDYFVFQNMKQDTTFFRQELISRWEKDKEEIRFQLLSFDDEEYLSDFLTDLLFAEELKENEIYMQEKRKEVEEKAYRLYLKGKIKKHFLKL